ncbi:MAG: endonuclease [Dehalococcoidia bacterium]|nr:endonuclease [Dehalococcoidia bacterium]
MKARSVGAKGAQAPPSPSTAARLRSIFETLYRAYGPQHWWPASDAFEMMVGAILTQSAAWGNVERAIANLKAAGALSPAALRALSQAQLARLVRPSGYFNAKARKLKALAEHLACYDDDLGRLFFPDVDSLRRELLGIHGVGEETADSIILYGARKPVFVIDAYTRRMLGRLGLHPTVDSYRGWQSLFTDNLPPDATLFNEYHALLVEHGKRTCSREPRCEGCALRQGCDFGQQRVGVLRGRPPLDGP